MKHITALILALCMALLLIPAQAETVAYTDEQLQQLLGTLFSQVGQPTPEPDADAPAHPQITEAPAPETEAPAEAAPVFDLNSLLSGLSGLLTGQTPDPNATANGENAQGFDLNGMLNSALSGLSDMLNNGQTPGPSATANGENAQGFDLNGMINSALNGLSGLLTGQTPDPNATAEGGDSQGFDLNGMMGNLFAYLGSQEDERAFSATDTLESVLGETVLPENRVPVENKVSFYGDWVMRRFTVAGVEFNMEQLAESGMDLATRVTLAEDALTVSMNGREKTEAAQTELVDGALRITIQGETSTACITDAGELAMCESIITMYFVPAE